MNYGAHFLSVSAYSRVCVRTHNGQGRSVLIFSGDPKFWHCSLAL